MHIEEGVLPFDWAAVWFAASLPAVAWSLKKLHRRAGEDFSVKPFAGLMAAVIFILGAVPVPVPFAGTSGHTCGVGLAAVLLGPWISLLAAIVALLMQAFLLGHGGMSTLGANVFSMGLAGSLTAFAVFTLSRKAGLGFMPSGFLAGLLADWATYMVTAVQLAAGLGGAGEFASLWKQIMLAFAPVQLPLGVLEGVITGGMVAFLNRMRPDILVKFRLAKKEAFR